MSRSRVQCNTAPDGQKRVVDVLTYTFGKGGRQPGAQYGPMAAVLTMVEELNRAHMSFTWCETLTDVARRPQKGDGTITRGVMSLQAALYAVRRLAASEVRALVANHLVGLDDTEALAQTDPRYAELLSANPSYVKNVPLALGGDHTQGLATLKSAMLFIIVRAILNGDLPLYGDSSEESLAKVREAVRRVRESPWTGAETVQTVEELSKCVESLIDLETFKRARNEKTAAEFLRRDCSFDFLEPICADDKGVLRVLDLKRYLFYRLTVVWMDAHADFNIPETSGTKNSHGMPAASACGFGNDDLRSVLGSWCEMSPVCLAVIGARDLDPLEKKLCNNVGVQLYRMGDIQRLGGIEPTLDVVVQRAESRARLRSPDEKPLIVGSLDVDSIHLESVPGTGTPVARGGPSLYDACSAVRSFLRDSRFFIFDLTEYNPCLHKQDPFFITINSIALFVRSLLAHERRSGVLSEEEDDEFFNPHERKWTVYKSPDVVEIASKWEYDTWTQLVDPGEGYHEVEAAESTSLENLHKDFLTPAGFAAARKRDS